MTKNICKIGFVLVMFSLAFQAVASGNKETLSSECSTLMDDERLLEYDLFLYQDFFSKDVELLNDLNNSGHSFTVNMKERLSALVDREFTDRFKTLEVRAEALTDKAEKAFVLSLLSFDRYKVEFDIKKDKRTGLPFLESADNYIKQALRSTKKIADFYSLNGEIQNQFIVLKGGISAIYYSTEAKKSYQKALQINKNDSKSLLLLGIWYLFAPDIAGGSIDKSLSLIENARNSSDDPYTVFLTYIWESLACSNGMKKAEAIIAVNNALSIAPENTWARWILEELKAGRRPLDTML